jgi:hypothetical protein
MMSDQTVAEVRIQDPIALIALTASRTRSLALLSAW